MKKLLLFIVIFILPFLPACSNNFVKNNSNKININNSNSNIEPTVDNNQNNNSNSIMDNIDLEAKSNSSDYTDKTENTSNIANTEHENQKNTEKETEKDTLIAEEEYLLPEGFVYVKDIIPNIILEMRYSTENNFTGRVVDGYYANKAILTEVSCVALEKVQEELSLQGLGLKIFDAYRPQKAVNCFVNWAQDYSDTIMKEYYYPEVAKKDIISSGYIAKKSSHSKGSTVDLTIINLETKKELDMGSSFDFFGIQSHFSYSSLTSEQLENREILKNTMEKYGFKYYKNEWWHYTYINGPFPNTYFDFDVK
ncbi:M15 family metallopeptidase [Clostridium sp. DL1XJH146]